MHEKLLFLVLRVLLFLSTQLAYFILNILKRSLDPCFLLLCDNFLSHQHRISKTFPSLTCFGEEFLCFSLLAEEGIDTCDLFKQLVELGVAHVGNFLNAILLHDCEGILSLYAETFEDVIELIQVHDALVDSIHVLSLL